MSRFDEYLLVPLLIIMVVVVAPSYATASDIDVARTNLSVDYARCYSYYMITSEGARRGENESLADRYEKLAAFAFLQASKLSNPKVTTARVKMMFSDQLTEMRKDFSNQEILFVRYHKFCNDLMDNPEGRLQYWLEQAR